VLARNGIFVQDVVVGEVRFVTTETLYTRTGDVFAYLCTLATLVMLVLAWRRYKISPHVRGY
jgi:apolipoprotein N-acyltransferase